MIHFDAHSDTVDTYFGGLKYTHGTPFRRAVEENLLDPKRVVQIGIRGSTYSADERDWPLAQGMRIITIEELEELGVDAVIREARRVAGDGPTYISFDIDALDPAFAPGTGTPEFAGLTSREVLRLLRGLRQSESGRRGRGGSLAPLRSLRRHGPGRRQHRFRIALPVGGNVAARKS